MTLTHNDNTPWADSATDEPVHGGLTAFGVEVVAEMNRHRHARRPLARRARDDARRARRDRAPVIFSHSSAPGAVRPPAQRPGRGAPRLPANGGVCMVTFVPGFVVQAAADCARRARPSSRRRWSLRLRTHRQEVERRRAPGARSIPTPPATLARSPTTSTTSREVAGIDHVGLGGDFDGVDTLTVGLEDVSTYPALAAELRRRGWSDDDLRRLAGRNVLRVLQAAEEAATSTT